MGWRKTFWLIGLWSLSTQAVCVNGHPTVASEFRKSKAVVIATVTGEKKVPETQDGYFLDGTMYQVKIEERFKGRGSDPLEIFSENTSGRFDMTVGGKYLLFVYEAHGRLSADNCGNSNVLSKSTRIIQQVGKLAHP